MAYANATRNGPRNDRTPTPNVPNPSETAAFGPTQETAMSTWNAPLLGRWVEVVYKDFVQDEKPRHWWESGKSHYEEQVYYRGEVVDRAENSAEYLIACDDGRMRWIWSENLRLVED